MNKKNIRKVIRLLASTESNSINLEYVKDNSKIENNEIVEIFDWLRSNNKVLDASSVNSNGIMKKPDIDYSKQLSLSSNDPSFSNRINRLAKNPIIQIIAILVLLYSFYKIMESFL